MTNDMTKFLESLLKQQKQPYQFTPELLFSLDVLERNHDFEGLFHLSNEVELRRNRYAIHDNHFVEELFDTFQSGKWTNEVWFYLTAPQLAYDDTRFDDSDSYFEFMSSEASFVDQIAAIFNGEARWEDDCIYFNWILPIWINTELLSSQELLNTVKKFIEHKTELKVFDTEYGAIEDQTKLIQAFQEQFLPIMRLQNLLGYELVPQPLEKR